MQFDLGAAARGYCDRINRRQMLRIGGMGYLAGLGLPQLLQLQATAATGRTATAKACIMLWLEGGPSTIDMWDLKPNAPSEIRGPYRPISTRVPGTFVGEHCHRCADVADKFTILRTHSHNDGGHQTGTFYLWTGYKPDFPDGGGARIPTNVLYPSIGSIVSRELGSRGAMPAYMNLPEPVSAGGPGFYGAEHGPFVIESDPLQPDFEVKDLKVPAGSTLERLSLRNQVLAGLEKMETKLNQLGRAGAMSTYYEKAYDLIASPDAQRAFDLRSESDAIRDRYGRTSLGQSALLSRRLVEAGCRFVAINHGSWDTHYDCFPTLENDLIPHADMAFSALVRDLEERGMLDSTLVIMMGEMGRTPRMNNRAGRDHWSQCQSVLLAGGGIPPGRVVGESDSQAAMPITVPVGVEDLLFTIFTLMGIDPTKTYSTPTGRPVPVVNGGKFVKELFS